MSKSTHGRRGFTLIETLVAISIVGILVALLLPAVQQTRESARRMVCATRMRAMTAARMQYHDVHGTFPLTGGVYGAYVDGWATFRFGWRLQLLPYLENGQLYDGVNQIAVTFRSAPTFDPIHETLCFVRIGHFLCPSDGGEFGSDNGANFLGNNGVGPNRWVYAHSPDSGNGAIGGPPLVNYLRTRDFPDGLSATVAIAERLRGSGNEAGDYTRDFSNLCGGLPGRHCYYDADWALQGMPAAAVLAFPFVVNSGEYWFTSPFYDTYYTHTQTPNGPLTDGAGNLDGVSTARSAHSGGVNVTFADGSQRFLPNAIDKAVWRALGTRNGNEVLTSQCTRPARPRLGARSATIAQGGFDMNRESFLCGPVGCFALGVVAAAWLGGRGVHPAHADSASTLIAKDCNELLPKSANANCQDATDRNCIRCSESVIDVLDTNPVGKPNYAKDDSHPSSWHCGDKKTYKCAGGKCDLNQFVGSSGTKCGAGNYDYPVPQ
jgi:prepilin-type N-terminal cleavage/methylation domain-containing protein/prepilin-type processing-associated H-X9-DG protein